MNTSLPAFPQFNYVNGGPNYCYLHVFKYKAKISGVIIVHQMHKHAGMLKIILYIAISTRMTNGKYTVGTD